MDLWHHFKLVELNEVMRPKDDATLVTLLNSVRVGNIDENVGSLLRTRFQDDPYYPMEVLHIFPGNNPVNLYNATTVNKLPTDLISINAQDEIPKNCKKRQT